MPGQAHTGLKLVAVRCAADLRSEPFAEEGIAHADLSGDCAWGESLGGVILEEPRRPLNGAGVGDGGVTDPLPVPGGFQVIRLVRRIPEGYQPFEEVLPELRRKKSAESYESQTRGLVEKLRQEYLVEVHEEYLDQVFAQLGTT